MTEEKNLLNNLFFNLTIPPLSILSVYAAIIAYRTFRELTFDTGVLLVCALINILAIVSRELCNDTLSLVN